MKIRILATATLCLLVLFAQCQAEETDYFDWKGLKSYTAKNYTDSIIYFDMAIRQDPTYIDAWLHKGDSQRALKDYNGSIQSYNGALHQKNDTRAAWAGIIEAYVAMSDYGQAAEAASQIRMIEPNKKENWLKEGSLMQMAGDYRGALARFDGALNLDAKYADAMYRKALSLMVLENRSEAMDLLNSILAKDPRQKAARNALGLIYEANGDYSQAREAFENASQIDPKWSQPRINSVHSLALQGKTDDAMKIFVTL
jgi:tetratricopeptide (TPR) repeat protein